MTDLETTAEGHRALDPDEVSSRTFPTAFRGFDPVQVRAFLGDVADELRRLRDQEAALRRVIAEPSATSADPTPDAEAEPDAVDPIAEAASAEQRAAAVVEEAKAEADRLLREARERVEQLGAAATAETTRVLEEARAEAARLRATATDDLKGRFEEAEATAVRKIAEAEREAASIRVTAREEADATIEAARDRGREMVAEAQAARERMLADLAKRKRAAQAQLEQLRAGRDRLLDTLKVARRSIDEMTTRFDVNEAGAGATNPPASGVPSGPVTTTPGAASSDARPRAAVAAPSTAGAAAAPGADRPRPVRARAVAIGEAPQSTSRPQPAPQPAPRAQIAAPQAQASDAPSPQPAPAEPPSPPAGPGPDAASPSPAAPEPAPRAEERRSSALRILRRNKATEAPPPPPPLIGRDSPSEGVRIIGRPAAAAPAPEGGDVVADAPEPEPEVAALAAVEAPAVAHADAETPDPDPGIDDAPVPDRIDDRLAEPEAAEPAEATEDAEVVVAAEAAEAGHEPEAARAPEPAGDPGPVEPLAVEEIRPRIEDLFARIRADRESATASARQVLAAADDASAAAPEVADEVGSAPDVREDGEPTPTTDADEHRLQARDVVIEPLIGQLTKRLKRALQDEQNATLDRLRTSRRPALVDQVLSRPDDQALPYRHLALPFLDAAARGGAAASPHGPVAVAADDLAAQLAEDLAGAIRSRLDAALQAAASDDLDLASLSERLSAVYREWKVQKVERLATHYLVAAHERGGFLAHPEGTPLRWLVDDDGPCPDCDDNALAGPTPRGVPFPTGQLHPPAHLGCRCLLTASPA